MGLRPEAGRQQQPQMQLRGFFTFDCAQVRPTAVCGVMTAVFGSVVAVVVAVETR